VLRFLPSFGWVAGLGLVGTFLCLRQWRRYVLPLGFVAAHAVSILLLYNFGRFRIGMMPPWIILAALAAVTIFEGLRQPDSRKRLASAAACLAAVILSTASFYRLHAGTFEFADAQQAAYLALREGDYELAEREAQRVLDALEKQPQFAGSVEYQSMRAAAGQTLAEAQCRLRRYAEGVEQFRRNRQLPLRDDVREKHLLYELALLQGVLRAEQDAATRALVAAEVSAAARELCALKPQEISYWAVSSLHLEDSGQATAVEEGLQQAWKQLDNPTVVQQGWYRLGEAFLAGFRGDRIAATDAARAALNIWPEHTYRHELEVLLRRDD
jgi:hypothetical protein